MKFKTSLFLTVAALSALVASAGENLPKTLMTERGKLLHSDDLNKTAWHAGKGKWEIVDGAMKGAELKADNHPAVARHQFAFKDAVIQYDVQVNGCKQTTFSINDAKEHLCRVLINKDGFAAQKDDHDHDGPDKAVPFGKIALPIKAGEWKTVVIEIMGNEMVASIDGKAVAGAHESIGTQKANFGFTVGGESAAFRNLRVWEAQPNPAWDQNKKLISAVKK